MKLIMKTLEISVTAVFAVYDFYALEFMRFLQGKNIRIPEDIQIIGFAHSFGWSIYRIISC